MIADLSKFVTLAPRGKLGGGGAPKLGGEGNLGQVGADPRRSLGTVVIQLVCGRCDPSRPGWPALATHSPPTPAC